MNTLKLEDLLNLVEKYNPDAIEMVKKAYDYASIKHEKIFRESGEPYIIHPLNVAHTLAKMHADQATLCAGLLHDVLEDTNSTKEELIELFGEEIYCLVDGVTNITDLDKTKQQFANERKIVQSFMKDVRIIIIKLADRLHNMETLEFKPPKKRINKSIETLELYVPLAHKIGAYEIKRRLEDLSLFYLEPDEYKKVEYQRNMLIADTEKWVEEMMAKVEKALKDKGINRELKKVIMNVYGIFRRTKTKSIYGIEDLIMIKTIVDTIDNCYIALGVIDGLYRTKPGEIKDYIGSPKNGIYRSLHTTVFSPSLTNSNDLLVKFIVRDNEMDRISDYGFSAYWDKYKGDAREKMQKDIKNRYELVSSFSETSDDKDDKAFVTALKRQLFENQIYVHTSDGTIISLPKGATAIDFAYYIHSDIGNNAVTAIINGEELPIQTKLNDRDRIKIITDYEHSSGPDESWLDFVETSTAKKMIKQYLSSKKRR